LGVVVFSPPSPGRGVLLQRAQKGGGGGGGELPYEKVRDAGRKIRILLLKETNMGDAQAS